MQHQMDNPPRFEPTKDAAGQRLRTSALNPSPPNNTLPSNVLLPYLEQGTSDDCFCLASQQLKPCSASTCRLVGSESRASCLNVPALEGSPSSPGLPLGLVSSVPLGSQPPRVSPSSTRLPSTTDTIYDLSTPSIADRPPTVPSSHFLPSGRSTLGPGIENAEAFFTAALGSSKKWQVKREQMKREQVKRLVRTAQGFSRAKELSDEFYTGFWSKWPPIFSAPEVGSDDSGFEAGSFEAGVGRRLRRLKQAHQNIQKEDWEAERLWLVCLAHEVEHISQWEGIEQYTSQGVDPMSAAITIAEYFMGEVKDYHKRGRNIVQVMKEGGPAAMLLEDGGTPRSAWEKFMTLNDITILYQFKRNILSHLDKQTRSRDPAASSAIKACFLAYGWSYSELLGTNTKVMAILMLYLQPEGPHTDGGPGNSECTNKRWRVDRSGASASRPDHHFPATSVDRFSLGSNDFDREPSESIPGWNSSHLISFGARNGTRDLANPATMGSLDLAINSSGIDPATEGILSYTVNSQDEFTDPVAESILDYTINGSCNITDLDDFLQSIHDQSMDVLSNYETDPSVDEHLLWTVHGSDVLIDPSTRRVLQGATSPNQIYLTNIPQAQANPGWMRSTDNEQSEGSWYTGQS